MADISQQELKKEMVEAVDEEHEEDKDEKGEEQLEPKTRSPKQPTQPNTSNAEGAEAPQAKESNEEWEKVEKGPTKKTEAKISGRRGFITKVYNLSPELAAVVGQHQMTRPEVVKKVWSIIKEKKLYDPKNKKYVLCNDQLLKIFGRKRFSAFGMMKHLKKHFLD